MTEQQAVYREMKLRKLITYAQGCEKLLADDKCEAAEKMLVEAIKDCTKFFEANAESIGVGQVLKVRLLTTKHAALLGKHG